MSVEASAEEIIAWLRTWKRAKEIGAHGGSIPPGFWWAFDRSIEHFEQGGRFPADLNGKSEP